MRFLSTISLIAGLLLVFLKTNAQDFTLQEQSFVQVDKSTLAIGDIDNDGDVDLFLSGMIDNFTSVTYLYINQNGVFEKSEQHFQDIYSGNLLLGDITQNGFLDLIIVGKSGNTDIAKRYNNQNGIFTEVTTNIEPFGEYSAGDFGDFDVDGDLDLVISGNGQSAIYKNENGTFQKTDIEIKGLNYAACKWIDYDNNGMLDIVAAGEYSALPNTLFYKHKDQTFMEDEIYVENIMNGDLAWSDIDADGDLDLAITGYDKNLNGISYIYKNDNQGRFKRFSSSILGVSKSAVDWGDVLNDGTPELLITGSCDACGVLMTDIYKKADGFFTNINIGFHKVERGDIRYLDYDNDGDLDVFITGLDNFGSKFSGLYKNNGRTNAYRENTHPSMPTQLQEVISNNNVTLSWQRSVDDITPKPSINYHVVVKKIASTDELSTLDEMVFNLKMPTSGNAGTSSQYKLLDLEKGTYAWTVQAIDGQYQTSDLADWKTFTITDIANQDLLSEQIAVYPNPVTAQLNINLNHHQLNKVVISDVYGKVLTEIHNPNTDITVDFSTYTSGIYFITFIKGGKVWVKKIVK